MEASPSSHSHNRLRQERIRRNWRQQDLADHLGTTVVTVKRWERGSQQPSAYFRVKLCALFGKSAEELGVLPKSHQVERAEAEILPEDVNTSASALERSRLWSVPYIRHPFFTGREEILSRLHRLLRQEKASALCGLGGIGKTQTIIQYVYRHAQDYSAVFWISAETYETIISSLSSIAPLLNVLDQQNTERMVGAILHWLVNHDGWLLIFDNVEDIDLVRRFLPSAQHGSLLFTSRRQTLGTLAQMLVLDPLTPDEGIRLLLQCTGHLNSMTSLHQSDSTEAIAARGIVEAMDGFPLALDQAGAYIDETGCDLAHYLTLYQTHSAALLNRRGRFGEDYPASVVTTLALSLQRVDAHSTVATAVLRICAFIGPDAIPDELFLPQRHTGEPPIPSLALDALQLDEVLAILRSYSLIKRHVGTKQFSIHRVVQAVLKVRLDPDTYHTVAQETIRLVNHMFPMVEAMTTWQQCQRLLPHALACAMLIEEEDCVSEEAGSLLHKVGTYLLECAQYTQSEIYLTRAYTIRQQLFGFEHLAVAETMHNLAELAYYKGQYGQAEQIHMQALQVREHHLGPTHSDVATSLNNLAGIYWIQGLYEQAEPLYSRALEMRKEILGNEHLDVGETLQNIAHLYFDQKRYEEAEPLYQQALTICEQVLGPNHIYLITIFNNLGKLYQAQGRYARAREFYRQASSLCERTPDIPHHYLGITLRNLAILASSEGEIAQAETWYQQVLQIRTDVYGLKHPHRAQSLYDLAVFYHEHERSAEAIHLYQQALAIREQVFGPDHPDTVKTQTSYREAISLRYSLPTTDSIE